MTSSEKDWGEIKALYSPDQISKYVERSIERMYFGTAPTLGEISRNYGESKYEGLVALLIDEIFKFAGLKDKFDSEMMIIIAQTMRTQYPWLKITELMHFVYLFRLGNFDKFYGKPTAATLMQMVRQYIKNDRERIRAEFIAKREREDRILEQTRQKYYAGPGMTAIIQAEISNIFSDDGAARARWRYQPYGTAMARAFFIDKTLTTYPGDMDEAQQWKWAQDNAAYVKLYPNLNITA